MEHKGLEGETYTRTQDLKGIWVLKGFVIVPFYGTHSSEDILMKAYSKF